MKPSNSHKRFIVNKPQHNKTPLQEWGMATFRGWNETTEGEAVRSYFNSCKDKLPFDTKAKADAIINNEGKTQPERMSSYYCKCCCKWHIGHDRKHKSEYKKTMLHAEIRVTHSKDKNENADD